MSNMASTGKNSNRMKDRQYSLTTVAYMLGVKGHGQHAQCSHTVGISVERVPGRVSWGCRRRLSWRRLV